MRRLVGIAVSLGILALLYWRVDPKALLAVLGGSDPAWLALGVILMAPPLTVSACRLAALMPRGTSLPLAEALRLVLIAGALNMVLPSKLGDIAKAWFMCQRGHLSGPAALSLTVYEKGWDLLALLAFCALGLLALPKTEPILLPLAAAVASGLVLGLLLLLSGAFARGFFERAERIAPAALRQRLASLALSWLAMLGNVLDDRSRLRRVVGASLLIWLLHLIQIWVFILALGGGVPLVATLALVPLAIFAGLLPFTFAGIGTRDAALVFLLAPYLEAPVAAALGLLCTLRYVLPALAGLPFLSRSLVRDTVAVAERGDLLREPR